MKISVIIPVYNAEKYLSQCLDSVCNQTYTDWEVIAVDDGSLDNSYEILQEYAAKDSRFIIETKKNEGPGLTRNRALDKATGDYIVFLDSDDYIDKNYFELLERKYNETKAEVIFIDVLQEDVMGNILRHEKMSNFKDLNRKDMIGCQMTGYMPWGGVRKAASRDLVEREYLRYSEDTVGEEAIFSFELLRNANNVEFIEKPLYHYINHPGSQSKNPNGTWEVTLKKMEEHLNARGLMDEYRDALASFAFVVLISWLLRFTKNNSFIKTYVALKEKINKYSNNYNWDLNKKYLRREVGYLILFIKYRLLLPVILAAKIVRR